MRKYTVVELIQFEDEIAEQFNAAQIKAPVHLYSGNEEAIIAVFAQIQEQDWVFCSWRSHYQCPSAHYGVCRNQGLYTF